MGKTRGKRSPAAERRRADRRLGMARAARQAEWAADRVAPASCVPFAVREARATLLAANRPLARGAGKAGETTLSKRLAAAIREVRKIRALQVAYDNRKRDIQVIIPPGMSPDNPGTRYSLRASFKLPESEPVRLTDAELSEHVAAELARDARLTDARERKRRDDLRFAVRAFTPAERSAYADRKRGPVTVGSRIVGGKAVTVLRGSCASNNTRSAHRQPVKPRK
jgi:hypothetical protein